ncbi:class I SAM-dependent methyltransferase [Mycobacterium sp.]|uniref:class I SAM-dependent methyltransferase n=1 Tax=Mycobacterium sp. TaxID=1785 RepID=UPI0025F01A83|nr:class I SAM-dependent methyltransferase [Mycobacterium sp.]
MYRAIGHRLVQGWLEPEVLDIVRALDSTQRDNRISGAIAEVGVHHGKFFIGLHLLRNDRERCVAIDVFADQHLNVDSSGHGDRDRFLTNLKRWASTRGLVIHQADSTTLDGNLVRTLAGSAVRLFSVDGGHTEQTVLADMKLAEASLATGGIVIADDVFNQRWPGVAVGTLRYLDGAAALRPFAIGFNKVFFTHPAYVTTFQHTLESFCAARACISMEYSVYRDHKVALLFRTPRTPRHILRQNRTIRTLYRRLTT